MSNKTHAALGAAHLAAYAALDAARAAIVTALDHNAAVERYEGARTEMLRTQAAVRVSLLRIEAEAAERRAAWDATFANVDWMRGRRFDATFLPCDG